MMTWQPIGPEQMDGRTHLVGWDDCPGRLGWGSYDLDHGMWLFGGWHLEDIPTHYLPGVRQRGGCVMEENKFNSGIDISKICASTDDFKTYPIGRASIWAPTGLLRWNGGVLEQEFYETFTMNREWRPVPNAEDA